MSSVASCCAAAMTLIAALVFFGKARGWVVLVGCTTVGVIVRAIVTPVTGSDVLTATEEAIQVTLFHHNPYAHYYIFTRPPGQPFPYLPGSLLFYCLQTVLTHSSLTDRWSGIGTVFAIALLAPAYGCARTAIAVAFFGLCPFLVVLSVDGSNETSLTLLSVSAIVLIAYAARATGVIRTGLFIAAAVAFGWAIAFKEFSWVVFPFVSRYIETTSRRLVFRVALSVAIAMIAPAFLVDPLAFFRSVHGGAGSHADVWGFNVWTAFPDSLTTQPGFAVHARQIAAAVGLLTAVAFWLRPYKTLAETIVAPIFILLITFLLTPWSSLAYYSYAISLAVVAFTVCARERGNINTDHIQGNTVT